MEYEIKFGKAIAVLLRNRKKGETDKCPFCKSKHGHGNADGHRIAHCGSKFDNSTFIAVDGTVLYKKDGYILKNY
jgi:hypothetical protein